MSSLILSLLTLNPFRDDTRRDLADCHNMHRRLLSAFPDLPDLQQARNHYGLLYRIERQRDGYGAYGGSGGDTGGGERVIILAQSQHSPDWSRLPAGYLAIPPQVKSLDPLYELLRPGMEVAFRLHANPTRRIHGRNPQEPAQWHGKRVNLRNEAEQLDWLRRKGEAAGFALRTVRTVRARTASLLDHPSEELDAMGAAATTAPALSAGGRGAGRGANPAGEETPDARALPGGAVSGNRRGSGKLTFGSVRLEGRLSITDVALFQTALAEGIGSGKAYGFGLLSIAPLSPSALSSAPADELSASERSASERALGEGSKARHAMID